MIRTQGDTTRPEVFALTKDGSPWEVDSAIAQVRESRSRTSTLVVTLGASVSTNEVTVGDGVSLDAVDPGTYWWDLQVTDSDGPFTVVGGTFTVRADVSDS